MIEISENALLDTLRRHAISPAGIASIMGAIKIKHQEKLFPRSKDTKKHWDDLKKPLRLQIQALQGNKAARENDPVKWAVYNRYLAILLKLRDRLDDVEYANAGAKTIPELAEEYGIGQQGLRWGAWVPDKVRETIQAEFDALYKLPKYHKGKRIIPFITQAERTLDDIRWGKIYSGLLNERALSRKKTDEDDIVVALDDALRRVKERKVNDRAPQSWKIMLPRDIRARIADLYGNGARV